MLDGNRMIGVVVMIGLDGQKGGKVMLIENMLISRT